MNTVILEIGDIHLAKLILRKGDGQPLSGEGANTFLKIFRDSDEHYLDWSALVPPFWVSAGGTPTINLVEIGTTGIYIVEFDPFSKDEAVPNSYTLVYDYIKGAKTLRDSESVIYKWPVRSDRGKIL